MAGRREAAALSDETDGDDGEVWLAGGGMEESLNGEREREACFLMAGAGRQLVLVGEMKIKEEATVSLHNKTHGHRGPTQDTHLHN